MKTTINLFTKTLLLLLTAFASLTANAVKVEILSPVSGIIRTDNSGRYVLLPVEEAAPEANVKVLVNNHCERIVQVHLAMNHVDYYVPFDLKDYDGKNVLLYVVTSGNRTNQRNAVDAAWTKLTRQSDTFTAETEKYRPAFHHTPEYGWMNDPNGMFYKDGLWHLCYQWNPYGSMWGNMTWGHSVSKDLIHWESWPTAIAGDGLGAVFSGSAIVDKQNTAGFGQDAVVALYTSAAENQIQSLAYSNDGGRSFTSFLGNPVITSDKECRDPNLYWNEKTKRWNLYLAAALNHEMWFYSSPDLKTWTKESSFGGHGCLDGVWECPDLMELPLRGTQQKKWVLICNLNPGGPFGGSATQYFVGNWDGRKFTCESDSTVTKWMDYGKDHYATVSWANAPEGRHTVVAWMSNWQYATVVPTKRYRSANSLPRELDLYVGDDGETYVGVNPAPEVLALRGKLFTKGSFTVGEKTMKRPLPANGLCEILIDLDTKGADKVNITLSNDRNERVAMSYDTEKRTFSIDRTQSGITDFSVDFPAVTVAPVPGGKRQQLRLFVDRSSIEAFEGEGRFAMTNLVFPTLPYNRIEVNTKGGKAKVNKLQVFEIN